MSRDSRSPATSPRGVVVRRGGIRWSVQIMGSGPTLLLVHGTGASSHSFRELMPLLADRFKVIAPDMPGHGLSEAPPLFVPSLPGTAAALNELLDALDLAPAVAIGHSAGAAVVARMTLDHSIKPELLVGLGAALVPFHGLARTLFPTTARLLSATSKLWPIRIGKHESVDRLLQTTGSKLDDRGVELYKRLWQRPGHVAAVLAMMANWDLEPLFAELPQLDTPFLLLAGDRDRAVPNSQQREISERLPRARLVGVASAGHLLHEEHPSAVARLIFDEVELVAKGRPSRS